MPHREALAPQREAFVPHMDSLVPHRRHMCVIWMHLCLEGRHLWYFRVHFTKIVPHKIYCVSPSDGQMATTYDSLLTRGGTTIELPSLEEGVAPAWPGNEGGPTLCVPLLQFLQHVHTCGLQRRNGHNQRAISHFRTIKLF